MNLNNSKTPEDEKDLSQTPPWFVKAVEQYLNIKFTLDVCCLKKTAKCKKFYSLKENKDNGLILPWSKYNWCNPPYSNISPWVGKAFEESLKGKTSCLLIPDKPEVAYIRVCRDLSDTIVHMPFRLNFLRPDGSEFLDSKGNKQGPKFPVLVALFTPYGSVMPVRDIYYDFRLLKEE